MDKISWTDRERNDTVVHRVHEKKNILHTIKRMKANLICHILCRNCLLKHFIEENIEGGIEVRERLRRRRKQLLNILKGTKGYRKLKEEALYRTLWRTRFGRGYGCLLSTVLRNKYESFIACVIAVILQSWVGAERWNRGEI
jgi:hypothetical protein